MRTLIALVCSAGVLAAVAPADARAPISGSWRGSMTPLGDAIDTYAFRVNINPNGRSGTWRINVCGGRLVYLRSKGRTTWFRERTTYGRDVCKGGATDAIRRVPGGLYVHVSSAKGKAYNSAGTLRRSD